MEYDSAIFCLHRCYSPPPNYYFAAVKMADSKELRLIFLGPAGAGKGTQVCGLYTFRLDFFFYSFYCP